MAGVSVYEALPAYQASYGLTTAKRTVPDVSYNANPATGVTVRYNSQWLKMGGTSAGAPQWAAIHALGLSATNTNLYNRAKFAYSSYFRDITSGSNTEYDATVGYDLVTGLGSPLTFNFGSLTVSPNSGSAGGLITLNGVGFLGNSANVSYLNPLNSTWMPIINNLATPTGNFNYSFNAPELLQSNPSGDNQPSFNNIVFRAQDNNRRTYKTTVPYTEWRRGLTQIADTPAIGLYGNNTNLATTIFVQNGQSIVLAGQWFSPGAVYLLWDYTINLGTATIDGTGFFNTTVQVPTTNAGEHTITINDGAADFCVNLTRLPTVDNDYVDGWHTTDFPINLSPDYALNETFYKINRGPVFNVTSNGQPIIITESSSNTLEYWSTWNVYGTGTMELPHVALMGIKLDTTAPTGSISQSNNIVDTSTITLSLNANDDVSGIAQMRFANENGDWSSWEAYATSKTWSLQEGGGTKIISVQYMDNAGLTSSPYSCTVTLQTPKASPSPTLSATIEPAATVSPSPKTSPSTTVQPSATPQMPELNIQMVLVLLAVSTLMIALIFKRKRK